MLLRIKTRMIQVRHVPEDVHRRLEAQAKNEGMSLSNYLLRGELAAMRLKRWPHRARVELV